jgi:hypothetical protein
LDDLTVFDIGARHCTFITACRASVWCAHLLWRYFVDQNKWTVANATGDKPSGRFGHTLVAVGKKLVLFGGNNGNTANNDLYLLDTGVCQLCTHLSYALLIFLVIIDRHTQLDKDQWRWCGSCCSFQSLRFAKYQKTHTNLCVRYSQLHHLFVVRQ